MRHPYSKPKDKLYNSYLLILALGVLIAGCTMAKTPFAGGQSAVGLQEVPGQAPLGYVEIQGVGAGEFSPTKWQNNQLNWVPDVRLPFIPPRQGGVYRNIYAPSAVEDGDGWRLFYGGWDGVPTGNDRVYSVATRDFIDFDQHQLVIDHGVFIHVNNVNVQKLADGKFQMLCTVYPDRYDTNKPAYFESDDGKKWNGGAEPYAAQTIDIVKIQGYPAFAKGDFNGANVLLWNGSKWLLYFNNWKDDGKLYWAEGNSPRALKLGGISLATNHGVNDVKEFKSGGKDWYLMGLHKNTDTLWYSLSNDGVNFQEQKTLFAHLGDQDKYIVALGFVVKGSLVLGVVYGAGAVSSLDRNRLFARWLQKRIVITDKDGVRHTAEGALGPERLWLKTPGSLEGTMEVMDEDGVTLLGKKEVKLTPGNVYRLQFK
jgi:hypothetical protein